MMRESKGSKWRASLARAVGAHYAAHPHVDSVILGGSTARGHADRFSDIEIGVFWHQPPDEEARRIMAGRSGGDLLRLYPFDAHEQVWSDDLMLGRSAMNEPNSGVLLEVAHHTTSFVDQVMDDVLERYLPDLLKQNLLAGIMQGVPLKTSQALQQWRARAANYPDGLALAVVRRHAQIDHFWRWRMWLQRGENLMMLHKSFVQVEEKLLHTLLGLNRVYFYGFKWIDEVIGRLVLAPNRMAQRLQDVYRVPPEEGVETLTALVEETYTLLEQHMPDIDVIWLRAVFRYQRPVWEEQPPVMKWT